MAPPARHTKSAACALKTRTARPSFMSRSTSLSLSPSALRPAFLFLRSPFAFLPSAFCLLPSPFDRRPERGGEERHEVLERVLEIAGVAASLREGLDPLRAGDRVVNRPEHEVEAPENLV